MSQISVKRLEELVSVNRVRLTGAVNAILSGHTALRSRLFNMKMADSEECRLCGHDKEDSGHICHYSLGLSPLKDINFPGQCLSGN